MVISTFINTFGDMKKFPVSVQSRKEFQSTSINKIYTDWLEEREIDEQFHGNNSKAERKIERL